MTEHWLSLRSFAKMVFRRLKLSFSFIRTKAAKRPKTKLSDPSAIFRHADEFYHSYALLDHDERYPIPTLVSSVFASELFFKTLICLESGSVPRGHHLYNLFSHLSSATRSAVVRNWKTISRDRAAIWTSMELQGGRKIPRDLISALKAGNKSFELIRYIYEGGEPFDFFLSDLPLVLRRTILHLQPTWGARDNSCLGRTGLSDTSKLHEFLKNGNLMFSIDGVGNWLADDKYYSIPFPKSAEKLFTAIAYKTPNRRISVTLMGPLGMTFLFDVPAPISEKSFLLVSINWSADGVGLYLDGGLAQRFDLTSGIPVLYDS